MGSGKEIRYRNLGGPYINHWIVSDEQGSIEELYWAADQLIYVSSEEVLIGTIPSSDQPDLFPPPRGPAEWAGLGKRVDAATPSFAAADLESMFGHSASSSRRLPGAAVTDFRLTDDGFRFIFSPEAPLTVSALAPAETAWPFLVTYETGNGYTWRPVKPIALQVSPVTVVDAPLQALAGSVLSVSVRNDGDRDARGILLSVYGARQGDPLGEIASAEVDVLGGEATEVRLTWTPPAEGTWLVEARVGIPESTGPGRLLTVGEVPNGPGAPIALEGVSVAALILALLLLVSAARFAGDVLSPDAGLPTRAKRPKRPKRRTTSKHA